MEGNVTGDDLLDERVTYRAQRRQHRAERNCEYPARQCKQNGVLHSPHEVLQILSREDARKIEIR
jgi:hypothetical protein